PGPERLASELVSAGCVEFGEFRLRSGEVSPIYLDLRRMASHPSLLARAAAAYQLLLNEIPFDVLAGIPYAGLPIATALALQTGKPMVYPRREVKDYGTRAAVEGRFRPGDRAVLIDDVATSGGSKVEAADRLRAAGLRVSEVAVLVDRQAGASATLERAGLKLHSVFTLAELLAAWEAGGLVPTADLERVRASEGWAKS
ncbi:MAG: orotate phosphoribosyltransferase, partial [Anaerolineales bacterium]